MLKEIREIGAKDSFKLGFMIQIFSSFNRASWCSHLSSKLPLSGGSINIFQSTFTMLCHPPCCVSVAPIAIAGTWGPCIVGSSSLISLEAVHLLWFYSEVGGA